MEPRVVAAALHGLVGWGLTKDTVARQHVLMDLDAVRARALRGSFAIGTSERAEAAVQLIIDVVAKQPSPYREATQELLWISQKGLRRRSSGFDVVKTRRRRAIEMLEHAEYFKESKLPQPDTWRHELETEFLVPLALDLIHAPISGGMRSRDPRKRLPTRDEVLLSRPRLDVSSLTIEVRMPSRNGWNVIRTTYTIVNNNESNCDYFSTEFFLDRGIDLDHEVPFGAALENRFPPAHRQLGTFGVHLPHTLKRGDSYTFAINYMARGYIGINAIRYHVPEVVPTQMNIVVQFPRSDPPDRLERISAPSYTPPHLTKGSPIEILDDQATVRFDDLVPGHTYGVVYDWYSKDPLGSVDTPEGAMELVRRWRGFS